MEILKRTGYSVTHINETVVMALGDKSVSMDYETALRLAIFLYHSGTQAKREAGDMSRRFVGLGTLTDASADQLKAQKRRDGTATFLR